MPKENTKKERKERGLTEKKHRSVILFGEWQRPLGALSLEQKGMLLDALLAYPEGKRPDFTDPMLRMAWTFMEGGLDENARKWEETRQRRAEAGTKGAESRWHSEERGKNSKCHAPMAKMAVSGSDSVSDTGSASDSEPDIVLPDGEADCADAPLPPPDEPDFCPPDEGEVRDYFIRKSGTEAQADPGSGRSMNPTAGGWVRTPCGTGRQRPRSGWPATGSGRLPPRRTSRKTRRSMPPARLSRQKTF